MSTLTRVCVATAGTVLVHFTVAATPARAQLGAIESLAERMTDVALSYGRSWSGERSDIRPRRNDGAVTLGLELLFAVGARTRSKPRDPRPGSCAARAQAVGEAARARGEDEDKAVRAMPPCADTVYTPTELTRTRTIGEIEESTSSSVAISEFDPAAVDTTWLFELGFGYSQTGGLRPAAGEFDLFATLREFPSVTLYVSYLPDFWNARLYPYVGLRSGIVYFHNSQAYDADGKAFDLKGETFQLGTIAGAGFNPPGLGDRFNIFIEGVWIWRSFGSLAWTTEAELPANFPKAVSVDTRTLNIGLQIETR